MKTKRTTINVFGKELACYIVSQSKQEQILFIPTDETWEYFYLARRYLFQGLLTISQVAGIIAKSEMSTDFVEEEESIDEKRKQTFRRPDDAIFHEKNTKK